MGYADGVKGYRLWDPTARKLVVSRDVVFAENELRSEQTNDSTSKETATVQMERNSREDDSSEAEPEHEEQEPNEVNGKEVRRSSRQIRISS